jgi:hypothetical protein
MNGRRTDVVCRIVFAWKSRRRRNNHSTAQKAGLTGMIILTTTAIPYDDDNDATPTST